MKVVTPEPLGVEEVEYRSVLVAVRGRAVLRGGGRDGGAAGGAPAARDPRARRWSTFPTALPIDAPLEREEEEAQSKIEQAKLIGGLRVTGQVERVRPGQAGQAIVDEAREIKAAAIVMPLRYRNGRPLYGKTLQTVLAKRPCRVIVAAQPGEKARLAAEPAGARAASTAA